MLGSQGKDRRSSCNECLLVGEADVLAGLDSCTCRLETSTADNPSHDGFDIGM